MIICHKHKFILVRVPKAGSSTVQVLLADSGLVDNKDSVTFVKGLNFPPTVKRMGHATLEQMVARNYITEEILFNYEIILPLRHPIARFNSTYLFLNAKDSISPAHYRDAILNTDIVKYKGMQNQKSFCFYKDILQVATIFNFNTLYEDTTDFIRSKGCTPINEIKLKKQVYPDFIHDIDRGLAQVLRYKLTDEIDFYNSVVG